MTGLAYICPVLGRKGGTTTCNSRGDFQRVSPLHCSWVPCWTTAGGALAALKPRGKLAAAGVTCLQSTASSTASRCAGRRADCMGSSARGEGCERATSLQSSELHPARHPRSEDLLQQRAGQGLVRAFVGGAFSVARSRLVTLDSCFLPDKLKSTKEEHLCTQRMLDQTLLDLNEM